jgi:hypothetical protein
MDHILSKGYKVKSDAVVTRGTACVLYADDTVDDCVTGGAGLDVFGVFQETIDATKIATGKATVGVALIGVTRVVLGTGGATRGARLANDANGKAVVSAQVAAGAQPKHVFAIALTAGSAGDEIDALLTPGAVY